MRRQRRPLADSPPADACVLAFAPMTGDSIECFNCGRSNPSWAQVCRSCGVPMRPGGAGARPPSGPFPTDRDSLLSIVAALATMGLAVLFGLLLSSKLPAAAPVIATAPPQATATIVPSPSGVAASQSAEPTPEPTPEAIGTMTFGFGRNQSTNEVIDISDTFGHGDSFCHSISLPEPFGVDTYQEEVLKVRPNGELRIVQRRQIGELPVNAEDSIVSWFNPADVLIDGISGSDGWGTGEFVLVAYRRLDGLELLAQGRFTLVD